jgi:protein-S-isoprenylcysteine O-methyltransferase Ste14
MIGDNDTPFRLIVAAELVALVGVRAYYSFFRSREPIGERLHGGPEVMWLTATLGILVLLHFGAVLVYIAWPSVLAWSVLSIGEPIRWVAIAISCAGASGEIWAAISLGASYSPLLRVGREHVLVTAGAYRWIRHPLYSFGLPLMAGWGVAACNWFITATGTIVILLAIILRAPREEAMMLGAFGESYREYMTRTGRFVPRLRYARG